MTVGSRTCHWQQQIYSEGEPQEDEFGAGVLWLRVSAFFHLVTLWYVLLQLLNMGFLRHFPFMVAEVFHAALCPGRARLTSTWQYFVKEIFNYQNSVGDRFSCRFGGGGERTSVLDRRAVLTQQEAGIEIEDTNKHPSLEFYISFWISLPVHALQHNLLFRVRLNWNQLLITFMSKLINHNYSDHVHMNNFYYGKHNY